MTSEKGFTATGGCITGDGVELKVLRAGDEAKPWVVFVHGYPDTHAVWLPLFTRLSDEFHCIAYDVRGAGESSAPPSLSGYRIAHLVDDLMRVVEGFSPQAPVHLVGHDWGSVQAWDAVLRASTERRFRGHIATYTSISGPALGHMSAWVHHAHRKGWRGRRDLLRQGLRSWYVGFFQLPILPELAMAGMLRLRHAPHSMKRGARNGLNMYRANRHRPPGERAPLQTDVPVQLIVPLRDRFLIPQLYDDLPLWCSNLTRHDIDAGHWVQRSHPDQVAEWIAEHVRTHS